MLPDLSVVICESTPTTTTPATTKAAKTMPTFENIFGLLFLQAVFDLVFSEVVHF